MNLKERDNNITNQGWDKLYARLEQDGLLIATNKERKNILLRPAFKWVAIVILLCFSITVFTIIHKWGVATPDLLTLYNEEGAPTLVTTLEDGSVVYLSDYTSLQYPQQFAADKREIVLSGNAFFDISPNKDRPFIIDTDIARVEVLGTSFDIKGQSDQDFSLSVKSGKVRVTMKLDGQTVYVRAGEKALIESGKLKTINISQNSGFDSYYSQIQFKDERLIDVVQVINTNSDSLQLKIAPALENRSLTMTMHIGEESPYRIAELVCLALNLRMQQQQNIIYISE